MRRVLSLGLATLLSAAHAGDEVPADSGDAAEESADPNPLETALVERVRARQQSVERLRGLNFLRDVRVELETPEVMRATIAREVDEEAAELENTAFAWAVLGLVPPGFPLRDVLLDVLEDAVGGYYNAEEERLVVIARVDARPDEAAAALEDMVVAHELVHALQDQHFDLRALTDRDLDNGDVQLAIQALVEGDASYAMLFRVLPNPDGIPFAQLTVLLAAAGGASADMSGVTTQAPRALMDPLTFPYLQGLAFAQALKLSGTGWSAVDNAFAQPPLSSEQILHPERYIGPTPDWPRVATLRRPHRWLGRRWRVVLQDTLGEHGSALLLAENLPGLDAAAVADGWDGDRLVVWRRGHRGAAIWVTVWDDEPSAVRFEKAAFELARALRPEAAWIREPGVARGREGQVCHEVRIDGANVRLIVGVPCRRLARAIRAADRTTWREVSRLDDIAAPPKPARESP